MDFSTDNLTGFYEIDELKRITKILAVLDAVMQPEESLRYHHFHSKWNIENQEQLAEINDGAGNNLFVLFSPAGAVLKGFDHESGLSGHASDDFEVFPGIYDNLPAIFSAQLDDPAFEKEDVTFCIWRKTSDEKWQKGEVRVPEDDDDGSGFLLGTLFDSAQSYCEWGNDYYERELPVKVIEQIYQHLKIDEEMAKQLNPETNYKLIADEIAEILN